MISRFTMYEYLGSNNLLRYLSLLIKEIEIQRICLTTDHQEGLKRLRMS